MHWSMAFSTRHRLHVLMLVLAVVALALHSGQSGVQAARVPAVLQEDETTSSTTTTTTAAHLGVEHAAADGHGVPSTEIFNVGAAVPSPSPGDGGHAIFGAGAEHASLRGGGGHGGGGHSSGGHSSGGGGGDDGRAAGGGYVGGAGGVPRRRSGSGSTKPAIIPAVVSLLGGIAMVV